MKKLTIEKWNKKIKNIDEIFDPSKLKLIIYKIKYIEKLNLLTNLREFEIHLNIDAEISKQF